MIDHEFNKKLKESGAVPTNVHDSRTIPADTKGQEMTPALPRVTTIGTIVDNNIN